jgi:hypothetical protein
MANLNREQLRQLARLGARARLEQLRQEEAGIRAEFPELFRTNGKAAANRRQAAANGASSSRPRMTAANRKAVSERMRRYWAERRKAKAAKAGK